MSNGLINRQYIGARYVPKIMGEWNKALQYEALSVVTYMGNSFTSKVPVPANVDINNEDYWVNTGNYNAQVENYRQETMTLQNDLNNFKTETNNNLLNKRSVKPSYYVCGDSFGAGVLGDSSSYETGGGWIGRLKKMLNNIGINVYQSQISGGGFKNDGFYNSFKNWADNTTDEIKNGITNVVIICGHNDRNVSGIRDTVRKTIKLMCDTLPQAKILIAPMSCHPGEMLGVYRNYSVAKEYGAIVTLELINIFSLKSYTGADNIHPTQAAYDFACPYILELCTTGHTHYKNQIDTKYKSGNDFIILRTICTENMIKLIPIGGNKLNRSDQEDRTRGGSFIHVSSNTYGFDLMTEDDDYNRLTEYSVISMSGSIIYYNGAIASPGINTTLMGCVGLYIKDEKTITTYTTYSVPIISNYGVYYMFTNEAIIPIY